MVMRAGPGRRIVVMVMMVITVIVNRSSYGDSGSKSPYADSCSAGRVTVVLP